MNKKIISLIILIAAATGLFFLKGNFEKNIEEVISNKLEKLNVKSTVNCNILTSINCRLTDIDYKSMPINNVVSYVDINNIESFVENEFADAIYNNMIGNTESFSDSFNNIENIIDLNLVAKLDLTKDKKFNQFYKEIKSNKMLDAKSKEQLLKKFDGKNITLTLSSNNKIKVEDINNFNPKLKNDIFTNSSLVITSNDFKVLDLDLKSNLFKSDKTTIKSSVDNLNLNINFFDIVKSNANLNNFLISTPLEKLKKLKRGYLKYSEISAENFNSTVETPSFIIDKDTEILSFATIFLGADLSKILGEEKIDLLKGATSFSLKDFKISNGFASAKDIKISENKNSLYSIDFAIKSITNYKLNKRFIKNNFTAKNITIEADLEGIQKMTPKLAYNYHSKVRKVFRNINGKDEFNEKIQVEFEKGFKGTKKEIGRNLDLPKKEVERLTEPFYNLISLKEPKIKITIMEFEPSVLKNTTISPEFAGVINVTN
jgi:hypothetical protein